MILFVGLGNPTPDSQNNRHNIGFRIVDAINQNLGLSKQKPKFCFGLSKTFLDVQKNCLDLQTNLDVHIGF